MDTNGKDDANDKPRTGRGLSVGSRPTQFQKGHRGRQLGSTNAVTRLLKDAVLMAAETSELSGGGKLVGYLRWASENEPKRSWHCSANCCRSNIASIASRKPYTGRTNR